MAKPGFTPSSGPRAAGVALTLIGIAFVNVALLFDGLAKGFFQGGGIAFILLGVVTISGRVGRRENSANGSALWLPSRDEDRRA
jgi:membrane-bound ClpP family serine protease